METECEHPRTGGMDCPWCRAEKAEQHIEELKSLLEGCSRRNEKDVDRINALESLVLIDYQTAKKAMELWESEYLGQEHKKLWQWAVRAARGEYRGGG